MSAAGNDPSSAAAQPETKAAVAIDEDEYLNETLLKSPPPAAPDCPDQEEAARRAQLLAGRLSHVVGVPDLPTSCRVKRLGAASATGISGVASVRAPLDRLTREAALRRVASGASLPAVQLSVRQQGLGLEQQQQGGGCGDAAFFPIETISYAVMDTRMPRIFCFVSVEIASGCSPVNPNCHAFLCDSVESCYRLVLAVTAAFNSAVNRSKAVRRRPAGSAAAAASAASGVDSSSGAAASKSTRVVHLAFTGDHEEA